MDPNEFGQTGAPQAPQPPVEATPQIAAPTPPPPSEGLVTLPSAAPAGQEQDVFEVKADDQTYKMTRDEVLRAASGGIHFEKQMQQLAPYKEMRDFVEATPGVENAIQYVMQNGVPQELGYPQQAQQPQQPAYGQPAQPQMDQTAQFLIERMAGMEAEMQQRDFLQKHPDANMESLGSFLVASEKKGLNLDLEAAYKLMTYDQVNAQGAVAQQQNAQQRQATAVEPGAQGAPTQTQYNPREMTHDEKSKVAHNYNFIE